MSKATLNINEVVEVHLTEEGRDLIGHLHDGTETADGAQRWQLWCLMAAAGPHLFNGGPSVLFHNAIVIDLDRTKPYPDPS